MPVVSPLVGEMPEKLQRAGLGPKFSRLYQSPVVLTHKTEHDHLVEEFDEMSEVYSEFVQPFSRPIFEEATRLMADYLSPDARVLDAGCGPGRELQRIARRVPQGEVVGIDLSRGMVLSAHRSARAHGLRNCAFVQSDVGELPENFTGEFDLVYSCLAHHHYPEPPQATREILRVLRPGASIASLILVRSGTTKSAPRWPNGPIRDGSGSILRKNFVRCSGTLVSRG